MTRAPFRVVPLEAAHERAAFQSPSESLNRYLRKQATQDIRRRVAACFVALTDQRRIAGYYTLSSASLLLADLPADTRKRLPRYPTVPAGRMGAWRLTRRSWGEGWVGRCWLMHWIDRHVQRLRPLR